MNAPVVTRIGASAADGNSITIPGTYRAGDLMILIAFRNVAVSPTLATGWTNLTNASGGGSSYRVGYKIAASGAETSGTWTNATGMAAYVVRGHATNKVPVLSVSSAGNTTASINYATGPVQSPATSILVGFGAVISTTSTIETPPTGMVNIVDTIGATEEYALHDTNGAYPLGTWPATNVALGASIVWRSVILEIASEHIAPINNYQFVKAGDGMSVSERIR